MCLTLFFNTLAYTHIYSILYYHHVCIYPHAAYTLAMHACVYISLPHAADVVDIGDYEPLDVIIVFPEGTTELTMCVNITVNEDNNLEPQPEMFLVVATAMNGDTVAGSPQTVTIISEDSE